MYRACAHAVLNELGDVLSDLGLYLPLAWVAPPAATAVIAFCFGAVLTEFSGVLSQALGRLAWALGLEGLLVPSAVVRRGLNLVVFPENLRPSSRLEARGIVSGGGLGWGPDLRAHVRIVR